MADKVYIATLTQTSTNAPVATELANTLGALVWTRSSSGVYVGTLAAAFTPVAESSIELPSMTSIVSAVVTDVNSVTITASGDGVLTAREVRILVSTHYCSFLDLEDRISRTNLAELCNDTANATIASPSIIDTILIDVDAQIDSKAGIFYTTPFDPVPAVIKDLAVDLSCFKSMQRRPVNLEMPKTWIEVGKTATQTLEDIANGKIKLPATALISSQVGKMENQEANPLVDFNDDDNGMIDY